MSSDRSLSADSHDRPVQSPPALPQQRPKSPPLAFEKTPNDALASFAPSVDIDGEPSTHAAMGRLSPSVLCELDLQVIVDQQANAIQLLHEAFSAERQVWSLEKERLYQRIASLEKLLKNGDHWSPAKSPILSPSSGSSSILSPPSRSAAASLSLPTISEDDRAVPLSARREAAPRAIDIPLVSAVNAAGGGRESLVNFNDAAGLRVEHISPPAGTTALSPPPANNRMLAGHTPVKAPRPPTPPPQKMSFDGIEDTPTRNNTHLNTLLTQSSDEEEDAELKGPLNMPELPNQPDATNFTLEMLSKKLEMIEHNPDQATPMVFHERTPGLASPANELASDQLSPNTMVTDSEAPVAPLSTRDANVSMKGSTALSPSVMTPSGTAISPQEMHDSDLHKEFEQGGIKLKKKASVNFGAPLGQLHGFGRKLS